MEFMKEERDYKSEILELILHRPKTLEYDLEDYHPYDISQVILTLNSEQIIPLFQALSADFSASIIEYLEEDEAEKIITYLPESLIVRIIEHMNLDDAVDLLQYLSKEGLRFLNKISLKKRKDILKVMAYKESEIGAFMSDSFLQISPDITVKEAMTYVTQTAHMVDYISIIYVVKDSILQGYLRLKDLIVARANEVIPDIMDTRFVDAYPTDDKEEVASKMAETNESSIPIINENKQLVGIITHDDLMDIIAYTEEEDYTKFAAIADKDIDIGSGSLKRSVKSRLPWLSILLGLSIITSVILGLFEHYLSLNDGALLGSRLAVYLPLILGMSGNTGTQSLAVMIRYLTKNEEIDRKQIRFHMFREFRTGITQGFLIGLMIFAMILMKNVIGNQPLDRLDYIYGLVTAGSAFIALTVSTTNGALIPIVMTKLKIDPAVASGPFITTVSDIITLSIYYSISLLILLPLF